MPTLKLTEGNSLAYEHVPPASDGGCTFVCFNALSGDMGMWSACLGEAARAAGHGLLLHNLRGQEGSAFTSNRFDEASIVSDAMALLEEVRPVRPVHVGLSIGGLFALKAHLAGGTGKARGIVLINTLRKAGARLDWVNDAVVRAAEVGGLELLRDLYSPLLMNEDWQAANRSAFLGPGGYKPLPENSGALMLMKSGSTADWSVAYEKVDVPTLVITGLQDRVFYKADDVDELARRLPSGQRLDMPDAGHMVPVEQPEKLARAIVEFAGAL